MEPALIHIPKCGIYQSTVLEWKYAFQKSLLRQTKTCTGRLPTLPTPTFCSKRSKKDWVLELAYLSIAITGLSVSEWATQSNNITEVWKPMVVFVYMIPSLKVPWLIPSSPIELSTVGINICFLLPVLHNYSWWHKSEKWVTHMHGWLNGLQFYNLLLKQMSLVSVVLWHPWWWDFTFNQKIDCM